MKSQDKKKKELLEEMLWLSLWTKFYKDCPQRHVVKDVKVKVLLLETANRLTPPPSLTSQ